MDIRITPSKLEGTVNIPASKSYAHRSIICAGLSEGVSVIKNVTFSKDIYATIQAMQAMGAEFSVSGDEITVRGISGNIPDKAVIDCNESGSTLRFIIPVAAALGINAEFVGRGRLPQRPVTTYIRELSEHGITFDYNNTMPFSINGKLTGGRFYIEGDVSSQFVTGLLFALPLLPEDSEIIMTSKLESEPYVTMTVEAMKQFGVCVLKTQDGYSIKGGQKYSPCTYSVEGDYSQAAFFFVANAIGSDIEIKNISEKSCQGDKKILEIISQMWYNGKDGKLGCFNADASDIPDLVPILAVLASFGSGTSVITGAKRLRIKESDRLAAISDALNRIGGDVSVTADGLIINPVKSLRGGNVESFGDHRIVMAAAVASVRCLQPLVIRGAEAVEKSYPSFFTDFNNIGGLTDVINLE